VSDICEIYREYAEKGLTVKVYRQVLPEVQRKVVDAEIKERILGAVKKVEGENCDEQN